MQKMLIPGLVVTTTLAMLLLIFQQIRIHELTRLHKDYVNLESQYLILESQYEITFKEYETAQKVLEVQSRQMDSLLNRIKGTNQEQKQMISTIYKETQGLIRRNRKIPLPDGLEPTLPIAPSKSP